LDKAGGAAGVLQKDQVVAAQRHRDALERGAGAQRVGEGDGARQPRIDRRAGQCCCGGITRRDGDHGLDAGLGGHLGERGRGAVEDDDGLAARVLQLVFQFTRGVKRVDVHLHRAGAQDADAGDGEGHQVGQHHRDAVTLLHAQRVLQPGAERAGQAVHLGVGERLAEGPESGLFRVALHGFVEQVHHGRPGVGIDGGGYAVFAVSCEPRLLMHGESS
jgi:hypothetical protein